MAKTMKAAMVRKFKKPLSIEEVPVPKLGRGQILVKIEACGVCHTDLHAANGDWPVKPNPPFIPGHEGVGTVAAVGKDVTAVREGDRVGVPWPHKARQGSSRRLPRRDRLADDGLGPRPLLPAHPKSGNTRAIYCFDYLAETAFAKLSH